MSGKFENIFKKKTKKHHPQILKKLAEKKILHHHKKKWSEKIQFSNRGNKQQKNKIDNKR